MILIALLLVVVMLFVAVWAALVVCADLAGSITRLRRLVRFDLLDLLMLTSGICAWLAVYRLMAASPVLCGPTMLMVTLLLPMMWLIRLSWLEVHVHRQRRLERLAAPPPVTFVPPANSVRKHWRFRLASNAKSIPAPRLTPHSLAHGPLTLDE